jgi:membrane-bound metal-dependent hydrolase YbcI (DUF457 family)
VPLPLGHTAIGWAVYKTIDVESSRGHQRPLGSRAARLAFVTLLANLPDFDVLFGLLFFGNGNAVHRGPTHSLLFAILAGYLASKLHRLWPHIPRFGFGICFLLVFSHVAADMLLTTTPVSMLWPLDLYFNPGYSSWGNVVSMVLLKSLQDLGIVAVCLSYGLGLRYLRTKQHLFARFAFARRRAK